MGKVLQFPPQKVFSKTTEYFIFCKFPEHFLIFKNPKNMSKNNFVEFEKRGKEAEIFVGVDEISENYFRIFQNFERFPF